MTYELWSNRIKLRGPREACFVGRGGAATRARELSRLTVLSEYGERRRWRDIYEKQSDYHRHSDRCRCHRLYGRRIAPDKGYQIRGVRLERHRRGEAGRGITAAAHADR